MSKTISLENIKVSPNSILSSSGYKKHTRGYIKEDPPHGRYHIIVNGRELLLHYDIYITGKTKEHFSMCMPQKEKEEVKRIVKNTYYYPKIFKKPRKEKEQVFKLPKELKPKTHSETVIEAIDTMFDKPKKKKFKPEVANHLEVKKELARIKALRERKWYIKVLDYIKNV